MEDPPSWNILPGRWDFREVTTQELQVIKERWLLSSLCVSDNRIKAKQGIPTVTHAVNQPGTNRFHLTPHTDPNYYTPLPSTGELCPLQLATKHQHVACVPENQLLFANRFLMCVQEEDSALNLVSFTIFYLCVIYHSRFAQRCCSCSRG